MRVLMLNRSDAHTVPGGDTIQMMQTKATLEQLSVEIDLASSQDFSPLSKYDIVHIFNWEQLDTVCTSQQWDSHSTPPIVLSPIFWFHTGHWYDQAARTKRLWKFVDQAMGSTNSRKIFETWQQTKFKRGARGRVYRKFLSMPARLLPNSETEIDHLRHTLGLGAKLRTRCTVIPNGVVRSDYDPMPEPNQAFLKKYQVKDFVLQVARIQSAKNQLALIEALYDTSIPIVFAGQLSPYESEYVNQCYKLAQQRGNVYFLGPVPANELPGIYTLAAVHVLPSWRETPGLSNLEAAASGCKIVSTSIGCTREYFGDYAWYCHPGYPGSIREAVLKALDSPPSGALRNLVLDRYTWDVAAKKTLEAYCTVVENSKNNHHNHRGGARWVEYW